jgi:cytidyltransferase-like protein
MTISNKLLPYEDARAVIGRLRAQGKKIVQCHGTFDLIHPGHIIHFEEAKALGDVLVVTITGEKYVNKGPGRPYFNDLLRVKWLAALECVDYVIVVPYPAAVEAIECVCPHFYCKGLEYRDTEVDVTGNIHDDLKTVERLGGQVRYVGSVVFSSTRLLNQHFVPYSSGVRDFCKMLAADYPPRRFREIVDAFQKLKVLVVGDAIFDRYSTVSVQGLTSKNRIISARFREDETQAGGALAVFRHIRQFTPHVKLLSLVGTESWVEEELGRYVHPDEDELIRASGFTTIIKQRFVEPLSEGKELSKLFAVNYIDAQPPPQQVQDAVLDRLGSLIDHFDLVLVMDFGHGLMQDAVRDLVQKRARFLGLNCQTNSNNHGFNITNRQYYRADSFSLDQMEMMLAVGRRHFEFHVELDRMRSQMGAKYAWLTRGGIETIGLKESEAPCFLPQLEVNIVDTVGAGDAFCALASLAAVSGQPNTLATYMGQLAGALAVRIVGNSECIQKAHFLKASEAMLNF